MIAEILGVVEKTNTRPLLISFVALSMAAGATSGTILIDPLSWQLMILPIAVFVSYVLIYGWVLLIHKMNSRLADNDIASWGPMIGSALLAFCVLQIFSYLSSHPQGLTFVLLAEPNFIYVLTILLLSAETTKIHR